jgi:hypothetical protein
MTDRPISEPPASSPHGSPPQRPTAPGGIRIVVALVVVEIVLTLYQGAVDLVTGLVAHAVGGVGPGLAVSIGSAAFSVVVALALVAVARGLAQGRVWAEVLVLVFIALRAGLDVVRLVTVPGVITSTVIDLVLLGLLVLALTTGSAKGWFRTHREERAAYRPA